jgi:protein SCO1/2
MKNLFKLLSLLLFSLNALAFDYPDTSLFHLNSNWTDQNGVQKNISALAGRPHLVAMVFTRCETACPLLVRDIKSLDTNLPVALFSFDSDRETPQSLGVFLKKFKIEDARWAAYTSTSSNVAELAAALGVKYKKLPNGAFIHSNIIFLVDGQGRVIAQNDGLNSIHSSFAEALRGLK